jgi:CheY-like chemotaxis protein
MPNTPSALALVSDLMFMVKIQEAAKAVGLPVKFLKTPADVERAIPTSHPADDAPSMILFDLNAGGADALALIKALKADASTRDIQLVGFISHVQIEARAEAESAGCDLVVARSVFSQKLPAILEQYGVNKGAAKPASRL